MARWRVGMKASEAFGVGGYLTPDGSDGSMARWRRGPTGRRSWVGQGRSTGQHREPRTIEPAVVRGSDYPAATERRHWMDDRTLAWAAERAETYLSVEPADNSAVFFSSAAFHEVRPVRSETRSFPDGRFSVNVWFWVGAEPRWE